MMLGVLVTKVSDPGLTVDEELALACAIAYPIKVHVNHFRSFLLYVVIRKAVGSGVVDLDWSRSLWVT